MALFVSTKKESGGADDFCSGCDKKFDDGEEFINGIESCCGQCYRQLCFSCCDNINLLRVTEKTDDPSNP